MKKLILSGLLLGNILFVSCEKDDNAPVDPSNELPATYNFTNVDHSGQDARLDMLSEIMDYIEIVNGGNTVSAQTITDMFSNQNYTWNNIELNGSSKQIANKISPDAASKIGGWINEVAALSQNPGTGSNGTPGLVSSNSGAKQYLLNENGFDLAELIEKGTMGGLSYYQATTVYLGNDKMNADNETVEAGKGTAMQHHWDEAFGYWGVPNDFGTEGFNYDKSASYHRFWAKYTNQVNEVVSVSSPLMKAFIKGRHAINNKDYDNRDAAIGEIRQTWEVISAAMAIHYLNEAASNFGDDALRNHELSEAYAFIWNLQFNPEGKFTKSEIDAILNLLDNLYEVSIADMNTIKDQLATRYSLEAEENIL